MNNVYFGMDGMSLDGTYWHNPKTGDSFMIRSNYFEDNRMIITTSDGRSFDMDKMKDYVQTKNLVPKTTPAPSISDLPQEVLDIMDTGETTTDSYIDPDDLAMIQGYSESPNPSVNTSKKVALRNPNEEIIERALSKAKKPEWKLSISWPDFPQKELDMLITVMDVPMSDIEDYYLRHIQADFNSESFMDNIKGQLGDYIDIVEKSDEEDATRS